MIRQVIALLLVIEVLCKELECPHLWYEYEGKCYFFEKTPATFHQAAEWCSAKGGKLFEPQSKSASDFVIYRQENNEHFKNNNSIWLGIHAYQTIRA